MLSVPLAIDNIINTLLQKIFNHRFMSLHSNLFKVTSLALLIKLASAPLNYLMLVALARAMDIEGYGIFAFGFSIALTLGQVALMGQQQFVMRVLPGHQAPGDTRVWKAALAYSLHNVLRAGIILSIAFAIYAAIGTQNRSMLAAALLVLPIAFAEYQSSVLRTQKRIVGALAPRDILWRLSVIAVCGLVAIDVLPALQPTAAFLLCACTLIFWLIVQSRLDPATRYTSEIFRAKAHAHSEWWTMSKSFWLASVVIVAGPNLSVVAIGVTTSPEDTAPFFAALKTAQLMTLLLLAANLAATPMISSALAKDDKQAVRKICQFISLAAGSFACLGLLLFWAVGGVALGLFGSGYAVAKPELMILSFGFAVSAAGGSNGILLQMAGQESAFAQLSLGWHALGIATLAPVVWIYGITGAAWMVTLTTIVWNIHAWHLCRKRIGIDPSMLGLVFPAPQRPKVD